MKPLISKTARYGSGIALIAYGLYGLFTKQIYGFGSKYTVFVFVSGDTSQLKFYVAHYILIGAVILIAPLLFPRYYKKKE